MKRDWFKSASSPEFPKATASSFANWVFEQSVGFRSADPAGYATRRERLRLGAVTHRDIELFLRLKWSTEHLGEERSSWVLEFADDKEAPDRIFKASTLRVNGRSLRCVPDVVLRNTATNSVMIIERKTTTLTDVNISPDGWPNVQAQLWCYSNIDEYREAPEVIMIGQFWRRSRGGVVLSHTHPAWRRSDSEHDFLCRQWFERYGGEILYAAQVSPPQLRNRPISKPISTKSKKRPMRAPYLSPEARKAILQKIYGSED